VKTRRRTDVLHARTRQHAPTTALPTRDHSRHALHASSSPDCLQLNRVDPPRKQPVISHASNSAQSSDTSSDQSADTSSPATSAKKCVHLPRHQRWARITDVYDTSSSHVITVGFDSVFLRHYFRLTRGFISTVC
jgi:hypothetical protein